MRRGPGGVRGLASFAAVVAAGAAVAACASASVPAGGTLAKPIDPRQQTLVPFGKRSHWLQPWRAYLDTVPASTLLGSIGINFNVDSSEAQSAARQLAAAGFRRARVEVSWANVNYDDPAKLDGMKKLEAKLLALKQYGIRPLILLNSNDNQPVPLEDITLKVAQPAAAGATQITVAPESIPDIVPGRTGFTGKKGITGSVLITSVTPDGVATLSQPLPGNLDAGRQKAVTLLYPPFPGPETSSGAPNPEFAKTMDGWLQYVGTVMKTVKSLLGSESFDVEVWNELTFGSAFLKLEKYYNPLPSWAGKGSVTDAILARTVQYLRDPANGVATVGIGDGFANTLPWPSGSTSPPGLTALDKHLYPRLYHFPGDDKDSNQKPVDALGQEAAGKSADEFEPTYTAWFPELPLTAIRTESLIRDISPYTSMVQKTEHGRKTAPPGGKPVTVWVTETGMRAKEAVPTVTEAQVQRLQAKTALRTLVSYVNKGVSAVYFFAAHGGSYALLRSGPGGGAALTAVHRLVSTIGTASPSVTVRPLSLLSVSDTNNLAQFAGDGTPAHPTLYDRDVVAFFPFQASATRYVAATYVMTRNAAQIRKPTAPATDVTRFDMPPAYFDLTVGGLAAGQWKFTMTDPLTGKPASVTVLSLKGGRAVLRVPLTDSVRLLTITKS